MRIDDRSLPAFVKRIAFVNRLPVTAKSKKDRTPGSHSFLNRYIVNFGVHGAAIPDSAGKTEAAGQKYKAEVHRKGGRLLETLSGLVGYACGQATGLLKEGGVCC